MYDEVIEEGFDSGLYSLVSCWNSYGIPCGMVGYDKDVLIKSCKPKLHIYNNKTKSQYKYTCNIKIHINTIHIFVLINIQCTFKIQ